MDTTGPGDLARPLLQSPPVLAFSSRSRFACRAVSAATLLGASLLTARARAEGYLVNAEIGLGTGLEGGSGSADGTGWKRARLRLTAGAELRSDETDFEGFDFRAFVELERRGEVGAEFRYTRWATRSVGLYVGVVGAFAPETLFGGSVGARFLIPLGKRVSIFLEPSFSALPLGTDVPEDSVLLWALFTGGVRVAL